ncbi:hypothetical protein M6B38_106450 [Iris pallida]|uniref:Uncharacterized protein n=1 Tax=Iris pallida TaxID=29817 RepID=A0AAX6E4M1_IRIPA|nr:hypothetical protein M6B38_209535 [Iris pallida]KAJ6806961.1 hypothetical protein M6B38_106450 [Iris pallida]
MRAGSARREEKDDKRVKMCVRARDHKRWLRCERIQLWHVGDGTVRYDMMPRKVFGTFGSFD